MIFQELSSCLSEANVIQEKYSFPQKNLPIDVLDTFKFTTSITHLLFQRNCRSDQKKGISPCNLDIFSSRKVKRSKKNLSKKNLSKKNLSKKNLGMSIDFRPNL